MAENDLLNEEKVLSVIWDGTGYGSDRQIWGGEFFKYAGNEHKRTAAYLDEAEELGIKEAELYEKRGLAKFELKTYQTRH